jgi:hypothetical protein
MTPYWPYLHWMAYVSAGMVAWRYLPLTVVRLVAAFTRDRQRHKQCMEVLRLAHRDASNISSFLTDTGTTREHGDANVDASL